MNKETILKICENRTWIFTDFFDTLVCRNIDENLILIKWAKKVTEQIQYCITSQELYHMRKIAIKKVIIDLEKEEVAYDKVMEYIYASFHTKLKKFTQKQFCEICLQTEIELEAEHIYLNKDVYSILQRLKENGKKIAIISDYMLPRSAIEFYLNKLKVDNDFFEYIFVSSEYGVRKRSGRLYQIVIKQTNCEKNAFMIGDNKISDYENALKCGFAAYHVVVYKVDEIQESVSKKLYMIRKKNQRFSFANYAFLFYCFIERLYIRLIQEEYDEVFFMAREGFFLKQLFEAYQEDCEKHIEVKYLYVSRKATLLPSIYRSGIFDFSSLFNSYKKLDINSFLRNLDFDATQTEDIVKECPFNTENMVDDFQNSKELQWLMNNKKFVELLEEKSIKANCDLKNYIIQNISGTSKKIAFVDIGWKGTIQDNISAVMGNEYYIHGFYCGLENITLQENNNNIKEGLVFSAFPKYSRYFSCIDFETHLIEQLLAAPHASTAGYREENGKVFPILEEHLEADKCLYERTKPYQENIYKVFKEIMDVFENSVEDTYTQEKVIVRNCLAAELLLKSEEIDYQKLALNSSTNNFGHFNKSITSTSKWNKVYNLLKDIKRLHAQALGPMNYLKYIAIKMNARKKYDWKKFVYKFFFCLQIFYDKIGENRN